MPNLRELPNTLKQKLGFPPRLVHQRLLDRELVVRKGTIRTNADKDDAWLMACAMHARCAIDVGANIGQAALVMLLPGTIERLLLIDPNPEALSLAADNLIRNDLAWNVSFICAFASEKSDEIKRFWTVGSGSAGSMYPEHAKTAAKKNSHFDVRTVTIDAVIEHFKLMPDLIKIDVEGAECQALLGATQCAARRQTRFFCRNALELKITNGYERNAGIGVVPQSGLSGVVSQGTCSAGAPRTITIPWKMPSFVTTEGVGLSGMVEANRAISAASRHICLGS